MLSSDLFVLIAEWHIWRCVLLIVCVVAVATGEDAGERQSAETVAEESRLSLEALYYKYRTDKSRDDHKYSDTYAMIFDPIRHSIRNITEVGVAAGKSVRAWHDYFDRAVIHGMDLYALSHVRFGGTDTLHSNMFETVVARLAPFPRVRIYLADSRNHSSVSQLGFSLGSMDIVIDDGNHKFRDQEKTLLVMWHLVRPGGYYVIEDVEWDKHQEMPRYPFLHNMEKLRPATRHILQENHAIWVDASLGHRSLNTFQERATSRFVEDRYKHNSHLIVIRKRVEAPHPVEVVSD